MTEDDRRHHVRAAEEGVQRQPPVARPGRGGTAPVPNVAARGWAVVRAGLWMQFTGLLVCCGGGGGALVPVLACPGGGMWLWFVLLGLLVMAGLTSWALGRACCAWAGGPGSGWACGSSVLTWLGLFGVALLVLTIDSPVGREEEKVHLPGVEEGTLLLGSAWLLLLGEAFFLVFAGKLARLLGRRVSEWAFREALLCLAVLAVCLSGVTLLFLSWQGGYPLPEILLAALFIWPVLVGLALVGLVVSQVGVLWTILEAEGRSGQAASVDPPEPREGRGGDGSIESRPLRYGP